MNVIKAAPTEPGEHKKKHPSPRDGLEKSIPGHRKKKNQAVVREVVNQRDRRTCDHVHNGLVETQITGNEILSRKQKYAIRIL